MSQRNLNRPADRPGVLLVALVLGTGAAGSAPPRLAVAADAVEIEGVVIGNRDGLLDVDGNLIEIPAGTRAERRGAGAIDPAAIRPGWEVKARAVPLAAAGRFRAARIEVRTRPREEVEFFGHLEAMEPGGLVVLKREVRIGPRTEIEEEGRNLAVADLERGDLLEIKGHREDDLHIDAREVKVRFRHQDALEKRILADTREAIKELEKDLVILDDGDVQAYVTGLGERLIPGYIHRDEYNFSFTVIVDPTLNAFALPDGSIYIHSGLIARMENEAQLAAVVGHEIAHVTQKHYYRTVQQKTKFTLLGLAAEAGRLAIEQSGASGVVKEVAVGGIGLGASAIFNGYSRGHEDEADVVGLRYMTTSGYDPNQAPRVWETFQEVYGDGSEVGNFFYGNHSTSKQRQENLRREIAVYYTSEAAAGVPDDPGDFLRHTWKVVRRNAAVEIDKKEWKPARRDLDRILRLVEDAETLTLRARVERQLADGRAGIESAAALLERAVAADSSYAPAHRDLGFACADLGEAGRARAALERYLELEPAAGDAREVRARLRRL